MKRIYVAAPYTQGDVAVNVKRAMEAADWLIERGFAPYVPHLSHFLHMAHPQPYRKWLDIGIEWLGECDAVLRLPGPSFGADCEVQWAKERGIPVFETLQEIELCSRRP